MSNENKLEKIEQVLKDSLRTIVLDIENHIDINAIKTKLQSSEEASQELLVEIGTLLSPLLNNYYTTSYTLMPLLRELTEEEYIKYRSFDHIIKELLIETINKTLWSKLR